MIDNKYAYNEQSMKSVFGSGIMLATCFFYSLFFVLSFASYLAEAYYTGGLNDSPIIEIFRFLISHAVSAMICLGLWLVYSNACKEKDVIIGTGLIRVSSFLRAMGGMLLYLALLLFSFVCLLRINTMINAERLGGKGRILFVMFFTLGMYFFARFIMYSAFYKKMRVLCCAASEGVLKDVRVGYLRFFFAFSSIVTSAKSAVVFYLAWWFKNPQIKGNIYDMAMRAFDLTFDTNYYSVRRQLGLIIYNAPSILFFTASVYALSAIALLMKYFLMNRIKKAVNDFLPQENGLAQL